MDPGRWWCGSQETWLWRVDQSLGLLPVRFGSCFETTVLLFSGWKFAIVGLGSYVGLVHQQSAERPRLGRLMCAISVLNAAFGAFFLASHKPLSPSHVYAGSMGIFEGLHTAFVLALHPSAMHYFRHLFTLDSLVRALAVRQELLGEPTKSRTILIIDSYFLLIKAGTAWYYYASIPAKRTKKSNQIEVKATFIQKLLFTWIWPLLKQRSRLLSPLEQQDLPSIHPDDEADPLYEKFQCRYLKYPTQSLVWHLHAVCWRPFYTAAAYLLLSTIGNILTPWVLQRLLTTLAQDYVTSREQLSSGLLLTLSLFASALLKSVFEHQFWATGVRCGLHIRSILQTHLFQKAMRLSSSSRHSYSPGAVSSLLALDACRIGDSSFICTLHWDTWSGCLSLSAAIYSLYSLLGPACHVWLGFMLLYTPISYYCGYHIKLASQRHQQNRDVRTHRTSQFLKAPLTLKGCGYEDTVYNSTKHARDNELHALQRKLLVSASNVSALTACQVIAPLLTFLTYVYVMDRPLNAPLVFSSLAWFSTASNPLLRVPQIISKLMDTQVSLARLERFFSAEERQCITMSSNMQDSAITLHNLTCQWTHNSPRLFQHLSLVIPRGHFVICEGGNSSGKTSFLELCVGMPMVVNGSINVNGTVAYCPQVPWILNESIKNNILFGLPMDAVWYKKTLTFCALDEDILLWPDGDNTIAGHQGSALSGGQKHRVSLARAIYSRRSILLLDNILSSLDTHVARHVLEFGLCSPELAHLTKILVLPSNRKIPSSYNGTIMRLVFEKDKSSGRISVQCQPYDNIADMTEAEAIWDDEEDLSSSMTLPLDAGSARAPPAEVEACDNVGFYQAFVKGYVGLTQSRSHLYAYAVVLLLEHVVLLGTTYTLSQWSQGSASQWFYITTCIAECVFVSTQRISFVFLTVEASRRLHNLVVRSVVQAPMAFFDKHTPGMILNRCVKDISAVDESIPAVLSMFLYNSLEIAMSFVSIALACPWVLLAVAVLLYPYSIVYNLFRLSGRDLKHLERSTRTPVLSSFNQAVEGTSSLVAYDALAATRHEFNAAIDASIQSFWLSTIANQWVTVWLELLGIVIVLLTAITATYLKVYHGLSNALVGLLLTYAVQLPARMGWTFKMLATIEMECISLERLYDLIHRTEQPLAIKTYDAVPVDGALHIHRLCFAYSPTSSSVLDNLSLLIPSNSKVAILGRTGAGKSSLVRVLLGLYPYEGSITVGGVQLSQLAQLDELIGFIPQEPVLLGDTLRDALGWRGIAEEEIWKVLKRVGMFDRVEPFGLSMDLQSHTFSSGEAQLLMLARVLLRPSTKILLCDEATAHMDSEMNAHVHDILLQLPRMTVLMICHRLEHLQQFDLVAVLDKGTLVQCGTPARVLANPQGVLASSKQLQSL